MNIETKERLNKRIDNLEKFQTIQCILAGQIGFIIGYFLHYLLKYLGV
jgi:hypothetical protein